MFEIRQIIEAYDALNHSDVRVALASVVHIEESSYRRIGARMMVTEKGQWVGGISGGCLEGNALKKAQQAIYNNHASLVMYDTMDDDAVEIGVGLGCNGRIQVLFTPIVANDPENEIEILRTIVKLNQPCVLVKAIYSKITSHPIGKIQLVSSQQDPGHFPVVPPKKWVDVMNKTFNEKKSSVIEIKNLNQVELKLLCEFMRPEMHLIIVGDNYDIHAMIDLADKMGWQITVVGSKKKISKSVYETVNVVLSYEAIKQLNISEYTAVILMSHDYKRDKELLAHFCQCAPLYLGMLGPKKRFQKMVFELDNINFDKIKMIHSPTGLEIGAETPHEIALSIIAEIVAVHRGKQGGSLHHKEGAIHDRHSE